MPHSSMTCDGTEIQKPQSARRPRGNHAQHRFPRLYTEVALTETREPMRLSCQHCTKIILPNDRFRPTKKQTRRLEQRLWKLFKSETLDTCIPACDMGRGITFPLLLQARERRSSTLPYAAVPPWFMLALNHEYATWSTLAVRSKVMTFHRRLLRSRHPGTDLNDPLCNGSILKEMLA